MSPSFSFDDFVSLLKSNLTEHERAHGVVYAVEAPQVAGTRLTFPGVQIDVTAEAYLAFVDREPMANWGHPARYLLVDRENGAQRSLEARLPPFQQSGDLHWRVVYKAPSLPDAAVAIPQS